MEGIDNQEGGVCKTKSMKIVMKVGQSEYFIVGLQAHVLKHRLHDTWGCDGPGNVI